jgi:hypothetical protein
MAFGGVQTRKIYGHFLHTVYIVANSAMSDHQPGGG